jgi:toxin YoeB
LEFEPEAFEALQHWARTDARMVRKILDLIEDAKRHPFTGIGKPEPLKHQAKGAWSRRIDQEHRLVYRVENDALVVISCRFHY